MKRFRPSRPSPALVVSIIALIVAMGGTGYAAVSLPKNSVGTKQLRKNAVIGSKIKKNAVTGSKVKDHSLTGADVNLGALGTVPSATNAAHASNADNATNAGHATNADNATNAGNANTVDGVSAKKIFWAVPSNTAQQTILDLGGLKLLATCGAGQQISLLADTSVANAEIHAHPLHSAFTYTTLNSDSFGDTFTDFSGGTTELERDNFDPGNTLDVLDDTNTASDSVSSTVVYANPAGSVVTVNLLGEEVAFGSPSTTDCLVAGTALAG
jgi:hypothetical protein